MRHSGTQSQRRTGPNADPFEVRVVIGFSQTLESIVRALIRRLGQLGRREPVPQPVRVRSNRTYPHQLR